MSADDVREQENMNAPGGEGASENPEQIEGPVELDLSRGLPLQLLDRILSGTEFAVRPDDMVTDFGRGAVDEFEREGNPGIFLARLDHFLQSDRCSDRLKEECRIFEMGMPIDPVLRGVLDAEYDENEERVVEILRESAEDPFWTMPEGCETFANIATEYPRLYALFARMVRKHDPEGFDAYFQELRRRSREEMEKLREVRRRKRESPIDDTSGSEQDEEALPDMQYSQVFRFTLGEIFGVTKSGILYRPPQPGVLRKALHRVFGKESEFGEAAYEEYRDERSRLHRDPSRFLGRIDTARTRVLGSILYRLPGGQDAKWGFDVIDEQKAPRVSGSVQRKLNELEARMPQETLGREILSRDIEENRERVLLALQRSARDEQWVGEYAYDELVSLGEFPELYAPFMRMLCQQQRDDLHLPLGIMRDERMLHPYQFRVAAREMLIRFTADDGVVYSLENGFSAEVPQFEDVLLTYIKEFAMEDHEFWASDEGSHILSYYYNSHRDLYFAIISRLINRCRFVDVCNVGTSDPEHPDDETHTRIFVDHIQTMVRRDYETWASEEGWERLRDLHDNFRDVYMHVVMSLSARAREVYDRYPPEVLEVIRGILYSARYRGRGWYNEGKMTDLFQQFVIDDPGLAILFGLHALNNAAVDYRGDERLRRWEYDLWASSEGLAILTDLYSLDRDRYYQFVVPLIEIARMQDASQEIGGRAVELFRRNFAEVVRGDQRFWNSPHGRELLNDLRSRDRSTQITVLRSLIANGYGGVRGRIARGTSEDQSRWLRDEYHHIAGELACRLIRELDRDYVEPWPFTDEYTLWSEGEMNDQGQYTDEGYRIMELAQLRDPGLALNFAGRVHNQLLEADYAAAKHFQERIVHLILNQTVATSRPYPGSPGYHIEVSHEYWAAESGQLLLDHFFLEHDRFYTEIMINLIERWRFLQEESRAQPDVVPTLVGNLAGNLHDLYAADRYVDERDRFWVDTEVGEHMLQVLIDHHPRLYMLLARDLSTAALGKNDDVATQMMNHFWRSLRTNTAFWAGEEGLEILSELSRTDRELYLHVMAGVLTGSGDPTRLRRGQFEAQFDVDVIADVEFWNSSIGQSRLANLFFENRGMYECVMDILIRHFDTEDNETSYVLRIQRELDRRMDGRAAEGMKVPLEQTISPEEELRKRIRDYVAMAVNPAGGNAVYHYPGATGMPVLDVALDGEAHMIKAANLTLDREVLRRNGHELSDEEVFRLLRESPLELRKRIEDARSGGSGGGLRSILSRMLDELTTSRDSEVALAQIRIAAEAFERLFKTPREMRVIEHLRSHGAIYWNDFSKLLGASRPLAGFHVDDMSRAVLAGTVAILEFSMDEIAMRDAKAILETGRVMLHPEEEERRYDRYKDILRELQEKKFVPLGWDSVMYTQGLLKGLTDFTTRGLMVNVRITPTGVKISNPYRTLGEYQKVEIDGRTKKVRRYGGGPDEAEIAWSEIEKTYVEVNYVGYIDALIGFNSTLTSAGINRVDATEKWKMRGPGSILLKLTGRDEPLLELPPVMYPWAVGAILKRIAKEVTTFGPRDAAELLAFFMDADTMEVPRREEILVPGRS